MDEGRRDFFKRALGLVAVAAIPSIPAALSAEEEKASEGYVTVYYLVDDQEQSEKILVKRCQECDTFYCKHVYSYINTWMDDKTFLARLPSTWLFQDSSYPHDARKVDNLMRKRGA